MRVLAVCLMALAWAGPASAQFEVLDAKTTASLRGIDAVNTQVAWASGSGGTVLLTTDGGANWKHCAVPPGGEKLDFRGVQGVDAKTAFVMASGKGPASAVYKTTDGCATWKLVFANPDADGFFDALRLDHRDSRFGMLLGDPVRGAFVLFVTPDGGEHWIRVQAAGLAAPAPEVGAFAASNTSLDEGTKLFGTGGPGGPYVYQLDRTCTMMEDFAACWGKNGGGIEVERTRIAMAGATASAGIFSLTPRVAVGGDYSKADETAGTAAYFDSAFRGWIAAKTMPHGYRSAVAYDAESDRWLAVGPNGADVSADDGKNWAPLKPGTGDAADADRNWNSISLPFVVGSKGKIGKLKPSVLAK